MKSFGGPFFRQTVLVVAAGCLTVLGGSAAFPGALASGPADIPRGAARPAPESPAVVDVAQATAFETAASPLGAPVTIAPAAAHGPTGTVLADAGSGIPATALAAYQRAAEVLAEAAPACRIDWSLLAAVGLVESDHGRFAGASLGADGVSHPAIVGPVLDGTGRVSKVADTDSGRLDGDTRWDRAVGPMQFLPSTWSVVGVDGDGDGVRSPDDLDDAALAAAVYLCAGSSDLDQPGPMRAALLRYNHSQAYATLVMAIEARYRAGRYTVPGDPTSAGVPPSVLVGATAGPMRNATHAGAASVTKPRRAAAAAAESPAARPARPHGGRPGARSDAGQQPAQKPTPDEPTPQAPSTQQPVESPSGTPTQTPTQTPTGTPTQTPTQGPTGEPAGQPSTGPSPSDPPSTDPSPSDPPSTDPTPSEPPSTDPSPGEPDATSLSGVWEQRVDGAYYLAGTRLDLGPQDLFTTVAQDYDGDGTSTAISEELAGLIGTTVTATGQAGPDGWVVLTLNELAYPRTP